MRDQGLTRAGLIPPLPKPPISCDAMVNWSAELVIEFGDLNARMKRIRDGE